MFFPQEIILKAKKFLFNKRVVSSLSLGLIIFFSLFSPLPAGAVAFVAAALGFIFGILQGAAIVIAIYAFIELISIAFVGISGALLNWVTSPNFVSISYTNPSGSNANLIVKAGLDITKNFVNLALVVILVYIAVAIALRLGENNAKRLFVKLIVVALLVNFAPLLVGLIVDATNIIMNYFLKGIEEGIANVLTQSSELGGSIFTQIWGLVTFQSSIIARGLIMIVLNFATGIALLLYTILFIFRYIAIWTIVILSPLAFVAWILPATKKYWDMWWNNLIQWSIIGIPMAFFLYLGARCYEILPALFKTQMETAGIGPEVAGLMNQTFPYFVVLAFLYLGFAVGLSTSAMGATSIIGWSKKAGGWVGSKVWRGAKTWTEEKAQVREKVGAVVKGVERVPVARWFIPEAVRKYGESRPAIDEAEKELDSHSSLHIVHRILTGDIYGVKAVGGFSKLVSRGDFQDFFKGAKEKYKVKSEEELYKIPEFRNKMERLLQIAFQGGKIQPIVRGDPRLAGYAAGKVGMYKEMTREQAIEKATIESRRNHIANWEPEVLENETVAKTLLTFKGTESFQAIDTQVKQGLERTLRSIDKMFSEFVDSNEDKFPQGANPWEEFRKKIQEEHPEIEIKGYFAALDDRRFRARGWREGHYKTPKERETPTTPSAAPARPTPGTAVRINLMRGRPGVGGPPPSGKSPKSPRGRGGVGT